MLMASDERQRHRIKERILLGLLIATAFLLRVWDLGLVPFQIDESIASAIATQIAHGRNFPLAGIRTSFGFQNPPLFLYLLAPFFAVSRDPVTPSFFFSLLGTSVVWMGWRAGMLLGGRPCAWIAALLLAFSPNAVEHCRRLWGHDLQVFFSMVAVLGALVAWRRRRWWPLAVSFLAAGAAQSVHLSGVLSWFPGLAVLLSGRPPRWWKAVVVGVGGLFFLYLPWMIQEFRTGFHDLRILGDLLFRTPPTEDIGLPVDPKMAWALSLGDYWMKDLPGDLRPWMMTPLAGPLGVIQSVLSLGFLAVAISFCFLMFRRRWHGNDRRVTPVLVMFFPASLSLLFFGMMLRGSVPPYHLPALVPIAVLAAWGCGGFWRRPRFRPLMVGVMAVWCVVSAGYVVEVRRGVALGRGTGIPLAEKKEVVEAVALAVGGERFHLAQDGRNPGVGLDVAWIYLFYWAGIHEQYTTDPLEADHVLVVIDQSTRIVPPVDLYIRSRPGIYFPRQSLHLIPPGDREKWLELLHQYPAPRRQ